MIAIMMTVTATEIRIVTKSEFSADSGVAVGAGVVTLVGVDVGVKFGVGVGVMVGVGFCEGKAVAFVLSIFPVSAAT